VIACTAAPRGRRTGTRATVDRQPEWPSQGDAGADERRQRSALAGAADEAIDLPGETAAALSDASGKRPVKPDTTVNVSGFRRSG